MSRIPESFVDDLLSRVDIVSVIDHRVKLRRTGKNYSACCPFHQEKTPSFTVSPDKQFYYCFGCGATGNAIGFVMEYDRAGFIDAVDSLAKVAGVEVPREDKPEQRAQDIKRKRLFSILEEAKAFYCDQLKHHPQKNHAVTYLKNRGLTGQIAKDFGIGFAPPGFDNLINNLGNNEESQSLLIDSGLAIQKEDTKRIYDRFRHRITFPIHDERGRVIGFGGRVLGDDKPKYLNSPETAVFHKGRELYGLYEARQANRKLESLLVVEGYMDVIALAQYGINWAVATLGTACGEEHLKIAFRFVSEVVFCFDGDAAGRTAAKRALLNSLSSMEDGRQIKFLFLPDGQDPDTLVRQIGQERFIAQIKHAVPFEEFLFDVAAENIDIKTMDGRARFSKVAAPMIGKLPKGIFKELMFENLAKRTGLSREVLAELQQDDAALAAVETQTAPKPIPPETKPYAEPSAPPQVDAHQNYSEHEIPDDYYDPGNYEQEQIPPEYLSEPPIQETQQSRPANAPSKTSKLALPAVKVATTLLLEHPELLKNIDQDLDFVQENKPETQRLADIIAYLKKRPESNFNSILGFWGGAKGMEEQQALAELMANQLFTKVKLIPHYNIQQELTDALKCLADEKRKTLQINELRALKSRKLSDLSAEEKQRLVELTRTH